MRAFAVLPIGLLGLAVGSFLNVVIYRAPRGESLVRPRSHCPSCQVEIAGRDNVPLVSWLMLRGRCRHCGEKISVRYPLVELATALLFLGATWRLGLSWTLPAYLAWLAGLLALALVDLELLKLPRSIVYVTMVLTGALLVLASAAAHDWHRLLVGVICALSWFVLFFAMNFASPRILGFGDVRLAPLLGLALGWLGVGHVIVGFFLANLIGAIIGIALIALGKIRPDQPVPYGVFLAAGAMVALFAGPYLVSLIHFTS
ncbi:MAG: prepilin peptidase [Actinomycetales bacterium]|nr:prepilin peptidase [Actinomycetales bacterium]